MISELFFDSRLSSSSIIPMANPLAINAIAASAVVYIHTSVHHKLNKDDYRLWESTIAPILKGHSLYGFVDGTLPNSLPTLTSDVDVEVITHNPDYLAWIMQDQLILGALMSSLTESMNPCQKQYVQTKSII
jgi:hypothetical protein